ncbi:hypothetical protein Vafri_22246 [Volvox africanus]|uniref:Uncharacterized protein n=1 Tax=Volvox africanus TaxID=51714 RepID=A0A8J4BVH8_9CHLO|nr:hypothetical protein Vafri_22246 [Volvox africanus]
MRTAEGEMAPLQECFVGTGTTGPKAALRSGAGWPAGGGSGGGVRGGSRSSVEGKSGAKDEEDGRARAGLSRSTILHRGRPECFAWRSYSASRSTTHQRAGGAGGGRSGSRSLHTIFACASFSFQLPAPIPLVLLPNL